MDILGSQNKYVVLGATVGLSLAGGFALGYIYAKRELKAGYEEEVSTELTKIKKFYSDKNQAVTQSPQELLAQIKLQEEAVEAHRSYSGVVRDADLQMDVVVEDQTELPETLTDGPDDISEDPNWDWSMELARRNRFPNQAYVLHLDEFNENEPDHEQDTLTYYAEDDTLVDEYGTPVGVYVDDLVGDAALMSFGRGKAAKDTVYVRNEGLSMDFEITKIDGKYTKIFLGIDDDENSLKHSHNRKFRMEYDDE